MGQALKWFADVAITRGYWRRGGGLVPFMTVQREMLAAAGNSVGDRRRNQDSGWNHLRSRSRAQFLRRGPGATAIGHMFITVPPMPADAHPPGAAANMISIG